MRRLMVFLSIFFTLFLPSSKIYAESPISIVLDGSVLDLGTATEVKNGRTFVPIRGIFEALGATVDWDSQWQTVTAKKDGRVVLVRVGGNYANYADVNSRSVKLDEPAYVKDNRTMVPLRFVAESFGADVNWDGTNRIITIKSFDPKELLQNANIIVSDNYILGAWKNGWVDADRVYMALTGNEKYKIYQKQMFIEEKVVPKGDSYEPGPHWTERIQLKHWEDPPTLAVTQETTLGKFIELDVKSPEYVEYVEKILAENGLAGETVQINQIVRTDIDNDGVDEVFVSASNVFGQDRAAVKGHYSFLVMRKVINGEVHSLFLFKDFDASSTDMYFFGIINWYTIQEIADFNGDGQNEIIIRLQYYEGRYYILANVRADGTLEEIFMNGTGL